MNYRHGDIIIKQISYIDAKMRKLDHLILAKGEATGHKHEIVEGKAELFEEYGVLYLRVNSEEAKVGHAEHKTIAVSKGIYEIKHQREHVPGETRERERRVFD